MTWTSGITLLGFSFLVGSMGFAEEHSVKKSVSSKGPRSIAPYSLSHNQDKKQNKKSPYQGRQFDNRRMQVQPSSSLSPEQIKRELKEAGGNRYALAINRKGMPRAMRAVKVQGRVVLVSRDASHARILQVAGLSPQKPKTEEKKPVEVVQK